MDSEDLFDAQESEELNIDVHPDNNKGEISKDVEQDEEFGINSINAENELLEDHENFEEILNEENTDLVEKQIASTSKAKAQEPKQIQLPLSKIRALMKLDPDLHLASTEAVFSVAKATELFIESLAKESYSFTAQSKKKTVQKRDVDLAISSVDSLMFLEGSMNF